MPKIQLTADQNTFLGICRKLRSKLKDLGFQQKKVLILKEWTTATRKRKWPEQISNQLFQLALVSFDFEVITKAEIRERDKLAQQFKTEVRDRAGEVDPDGEHHWGTLTLGWAIGKGLEPEKASEFATYIRYHTDLG